MNEKLLKEFIEEMESEQETPCQTPYSLDAYSDMKTRQILKEIDEKRNHSWIKEIWIRNKNGLDNTAIIYRGQKFTYKEFFMMSYKYAKSLKARGMQKGQEFICCIENTPEFPFIMGATSILGAKVNLLSADMDQDYLVKIINNANSPFIFVSDKNFIEFAPTLHKVAKEKEIIILPLEYSLKNGNPYRILTEKYYKLDELAYEKAISTFNNIISLDEFLSSADKCTAPVYSHTGLSDEFTITYTSGSTNSNKPKGLVHTVRSYITMGRYHDVEISHIPTMKNRTMLALVRTMSDTAFMSAVSDVFMQGGNVALEPINEKEFALESLMINKPTVALNSRSVWIYIMKKQLNDEKYRNVKLPFLFAPICIGEPLAANEEKALNRWLRKTKAGTGVTKLPFSFTCMSIAGGDSEHGGIFLKMYRALQTQKYRIKGLNEPIGMKAYGMVDLAALREDGTHCDYMEPGRLVANSPCTMEGYVANPSAEKEFFIQDAYGKIWANLNTYGYIDRLHHAYVKGRINTYDGEIPNYRIADEILKDTKKIMSCEVITVDDAEQATYVAHIEPQIGVSFDKEKVLNGAAHRCMNAFGEEFLDRLYFRTRNNEESFELTPTLKRSFLALISEGISDECIKASSTIKENDKTNNQKVLQKNFKKN